MISDYETGAVEGVPEEPATVKKELEEESPNKPSLLFPGLIKRGRGRPPKSSVTTTQIQSLLQNMGVIPGIDRLCFQTASTPLVLCIKCDLYHYKLLFKNIF